MIYRYEVRKDEHTCLRSWDTKRIEENLQRQLSNFKTLWNNFNFFVYNKHLRFNNWHQKYDISLNSEDTKDADDL